MSLSNDLVSAFVKITNDTKKEKTEKIAYGTVVENQDKSVTKASKVTLVRLDGADVDTPVLSTINGVPDDRVIISFKNHTATVTGNLTSPSVVNQNIINIEGDVSGIGDSVVKMEQLIADKVSTKELAAEKSRIDTLVTNNATIRTELDAAKADIEELNTNKLSAEQADLKYADIEEFRATKGVVDNLKIASGDVGELAAKVAEIETLTAGKLSAEQADAKYAAITELDAVEADIEDLETKKLSATEAALKYANIDFSNIGEAAIRKIFADTGIIENIVVSEGTITGRLVGVTISGDKIEGNTIIAEKLVVKGEDGLYYKLNTDGVTTEAEQTDYNSLNGSVIKAKSITATKISVDDLVAFDATIGGFNITKSSLYSGVKSSVDNTTEGTYLDKEGQVAIGDSNRFIKYYKDINGLRKLVIAADNIIFATTNKSVEATISEIQVGGRNLLKNSRNISLFTNNSNKYPIASEVIKENDREFTRYSRTEPDLYPTTMSLYSTIPVDSVTESLTGQEITFSFLIRCSHETTVTTMNNIVIDGVNSVWSSNSVQHTVGIDWKRIFVTATIKQEYDYIASNVLRFNPSNITIPEGEIENFYIDVCEWKIEKGNKATDWTPAPEDLATSTEVNATRTIADEANTRSTNTETLIAQLSESISMLVTDGNGTSLMTQTENGWVFSTAKIQSLVDSISDDLNSLKEEVGDTGSTVDILQQAVADLGTMAEYVKIGTYEDEPCIDLGEADSEFKLRITNTRMMFTEGSTVLAYFNNQSFHVKKAVVEEELQQGGFVWKVRSNGNLGLVWKGGHN